MLRQSLLICLPFIICELQMTMLINKRFVSFSSGMPFLFPLKHRLTGSWVTLVAQERCTAPGHQWPVCGVVTEVSRQLPLVCCGEFSVLLAPPGAAEVSVSVVQQDTGRRGLGSAASQPEEGLGNTCPGNDVRWSLVSRNRISFNLHHSQWLLIR